MGKFNDKQSFPVVSILSSWNFYYSIASLPFLCNLDTKIWSISIPSLDIKNPPTTLSYAYEIIIFPFTYDIILVFTADINLLSAILGKFDKKYVFISSSNTNLDQAFALDVLDPIDTTQ